MTHSIRPFVAWAALIALLVAVPMTTHAREGTAPAAGAASSEKKVLERVDKKLAERRQAMMKEAQMALDETSAALSSLDQGKSQEALEALARATGKLELVIARDPELALAPVEVQLATYDLYATPEAVRAARDEAEELLEDGDVQGARSLLANLASEMVISVQNLPLATYPEAIKAISPLIDEGRTEEAKRALRAALNTLVVTEHVIPLPVLRARFLLDQAEQLANQKEPMKEKMKEKEEQPSVGQLIADAREQIEMAKLLGYGEAANHAQLHEQIAALEKKISGDQETSGLFAKLRHSLDGLESALFE